MAHLDVPKTIEKFRRMEIWKEKKAVCGDYL